MANMQLSDKLELAVLRVCEQLNTLKPRPNWAQRREHSLWHELVACMLGSRVSFEHAQAAARYLDSEGLLDVTVCFRDREHFELRISEALSLGMYPPPTQAGGWRQYRYPKLRANHIRRTAESMYQARKSIKDLLRSSKGSRDARAGIISAAVGIGPKQSSLFLRNIGYADDLAILDTHVLRYMFLLRFLPATAGGTTNLASYEKIEERLQGYAEKTSLNLSRLDTAIWVVMRVFQKEFAQ